MAPADDAPGIQGEQRLPARDAVLRRDRAAGREIGQRRELHLLIGKRLGEHFLRLFYLKRAGRVPTGRVESEDNRLTTQTGKGGCARLR